MCSRALDNNCLISSVISPYTVRISSIEQCRAYVKRRGPRRKGVKYGCNSFIALPHGSKPVSSGMGIAISIINMQAVIKLLAYLLSGDSCSRVVLHAPFQKQVSVSGEDYLCVTELCVSEL